MDLIMDGLLIAGALFAGAYCVVLSRRVAALQKLDAGLGGAIVSLTRQIELARATLDEARAAAGADRRELTQLLGRADAAAAQLRLLLAASERAGAPTQKPRTPPAEEDEAEAAPPKPRRVGEGGLAPRRPAPQAAEEDVIAALAALAAGRR